MNNKGMFYTNVSDYETKEDMMNDFIALRMYDMAKDKEIERLNNIIKRLEKDLREMYLTFGEFSEEYTENRIKELKGSDNE